MKLDDLMKTTKIKKFTKKCLLNDSFTECKNACLEILKKSKNIEEFIETFLNKKNLREYQGYWELAKEQDVTKLRKLAIEYLADNKINNDIKCVTTVSDKGSIKIGNDSFSIGVSNFYGDCYNNIVYIIENRSNDLNFDFAEFITTIEGNEMYIYNYDCGTEKALKLNGTEYAIYAIEKLVIFIKWN